MKKIQFDPYKTWKLNVDDALNILYQRRTLIGGERLKYFIDYYQITTDELAKALKVDAAYIRNQCAASELDTDLIEKMGKKFHPGCVVTEKYLLGETEFLCNREEYLYSELFFKIKKLQIINDILLVMGYKQGHAILNPDTFLSGTEHIDNTMGDHTEIDIVSMHDLKKYYHRDDGLKLLFELWNTCEEFINNNLLEKEHISYKYRVKIKFDEVDESQILWGESQLATETYISLKGKYVTRFFFIAREEGLYHCDLPFIHNLSFEPESIKYRSCDDLIYKLLILREGKAIFLTKKVPLKILREYDIIGEVATLGIPSEIVDAGRGYIKVDITILE